MLYDEPTLRAPAGPPGCGKGTQAPKIKARIDSDHLPGAANPATCNSRSQKV